ncbi:hypothetical protein OB920_19450 [Halobacteria archaeon HArc-gm2]|nr:hypothetical protein [Halobacteria archaeon HArc-gm2]
MDSTERDGDGESAPAMGDLTERLHVNIPLTEAYVFRGPKLTLLINRRATSPESRILDED